MDITEFHKKNMIIWGAILLGMIAISAVAYFLENSLIFVPVPEGIAIKNILFIIAILFAVAILYLKRSFLSPETVVAKAVNILPENPAEYVLLNIRKNYIILWALSELILFMGFVEYVFVVNFRSFLIYAVVGIYALVINIPKQSFNEKCLELLNEKK